MKNRILLSFFLLTQIAGFAQMQSYYEGVDFSLNGLPLKQALAQKITNTHTNNLSYTPGVWNALKITDLDPDNDDFVLLLYGWENGSDGDQTNDIRRSKNSNGGNNGQWNREHVYARSVGVPDLGSSGPGSDVHHLRATDVQRNNSRGNRKFAEGSGNSGSVGAYWYPGDEWKGDVARMMMYMYVRYGTQCLPASIGVGSTENTPDGMIDLFLQWNAEDPVSEVEIQRNNYLSSNGQYAQGNRNPFIDNPYLATKIWGGPDAEDRWGTLSNWNVSEDALFSLYPNPAKDNEIHIQSKEHIQSVVVYGVDGKLIHSFNNPEFYNNQFTVRRLDSGFYLMVVTTTSGASAVKKFTVK